MKTFTANITVEIFAEDQPDAHQRATTIVDKLNEVVGEDDFFELFTVIEDGDDQAGVALNLADLEKNDKLAVAVDLNHASYDPDEVDIPF